MKADKRKQGLHWAWASYYVERDGTEMEPYLTAACGPPLNQLTNYMPL